MADLLRDGQYKSVIQSGSHGEKFQKEVALALFLRMRECSSRFILAYDVQEADKFDDVVLIDDERKEINFIQVKHADAKADEVKNIELDALFPTLGKKNRGGDFDMCKYIRSFLTVNHRFEEGKSHKKFNKKFYILTNKHLVFKDDLKLVEKVEEQEVNKILQFPQFNVRHLKLTPAEKTIKELGEQINKDFIEVKEEIEEVFNSRKVGPVLKYYCTPLEDVLKIDKNKNCSFQESFSSESKQFSVANLFNMLKDRLDMTTHVPIENNFLQVKSTSKFLPPYVSEDEIKDFFSNSFTLSVCLPNDLRPIIDCELWSWMKSCIKPDIVGTFCNKKLEQAFWELKTTFDKLNEPNENKINSALKQSDVEECLENIRAGLKVFESQEEHEFQENYINRKIVYKAAVEQTDGLITDSDDGLSFAVQHSISDAKFVEELRGTFKYHQHIVLVAEPGIGKTSLLQFLAFDIQKRNDVDVFLVYFSSLVKELDKLERISNLNAVLRVLSAALSEESLRIIEETPDKGDNRGHPIVILFDGFNEIHSKYTYRFIEMLKQLTLKKSIQIIISARMHFQKLLENTFGIESMFLEPISEETQINYLRKMWSVSITAEKSFLIYSKKLLAKFNSRIPSNLCEISRLPLMMRMLAEIYSDKFEQFLEVATTNNEQQLDFSVEKLNIVQLYEQFIRKCFNFKLLEKYQRDFDYSELNSMIKVYVLEHQLLAMKLLNIEIFEDLCKNPSLKQKYEKFRIRCEMGSENSLLVKVVNKTILFRHLSYCEYFVAKYLCDHIFTLKADHTFSILTEHDVVRKFTMIMMEENEAYFDIINDLCKINWKIALWLCESGCVNIVSSLEDNFKSFSSSNLNMILQASAKNGNVQICKLLLKYNSNSNANPRKNTGQFHLNISAAKGHKNVSELFIVNNNVVNAVDDKQRTALHSAALNGHDTVVKLLIQYHANVDAQTEDQWTALHLAAHEGHDQVIRLLIDAGAITNSRTNAGQTLLHVAAANGHKNASELFIANNNDVNAVDDKQWTALHLAAKEGHEQVIRLLIDSGAISNSRTNAGQTPLHLAAANGHKNASELFIANNNDVNAVDDEQWTALHLAAQEGHDQVIRLLIKAGAITNSRTNAGLTPLLIAATNGHKNASELFIAKYSDVNAVDYERWTALHLAAQEGHDQVIRLLIDAGAITNSRTTAGQTPLHIAAMNGHKNASELFIANNNDVNAVDDEQWTALHLAAQEGHDQVIRLLIDAGAITNSRTNAGLTPLHIAATNGHKNASELFIAKYSDVNAVDYERWTALHLAAQEGHDQVIRLLIDAGAITNSRTTAGQTPLHIAAMNGHKNASELFIANNNDVNAVDDEQWTALHLAAQEGHDQVIRLLIDAGAITNSRTNAGLTPLHIAATNGHQNASELFIANYSDVNAVDDEQRTALHSAALNGHDIVVKLLIQYHVNVDAQQQNKWTALHLTAQEGHDQVIRLLIDAGAITNSRTNAGLTPLHIAATNGHKNASELFIANNNDVNAVDDEQWTALHLAAQEGHDEVIQILIKAGAITNSRTNAGLTPLHIAATNGHQNASELFIANYSDVNAVDDEQRTALHSAALNGHDIVVKLLIQYHVNVDAQQQNKWTALHLAAQEGQDQVIRLLIDAGVITNSRTNAGLTPLHIAAANGHKSATELFIANYSDVNAVDYQQRTALHLAASGGHDTVVELLIKYHANVDVQEQNKWTALHWAAYNGHHTVVELLLRNKANIDAQNKYKSTALHLAAEKEHYQVIKLLLKYRANTKLKNFNDETALLIIKRRKRKGIKSGFHEIYDVHKILKTNFVEGFDWEELDFLYINRRISFKAIGFESTKALNVIDDVIDRQFDGSMSHKFQKSSSSKNAKASSLQSAAHRKISDAKFVEVHQEIFKVHQHILLVAEPGMGKTSFLQYLEFKLQKKRDVDVFLVHFSDLVDKLAAFQKITNVDLTLNILKPALSTVPDRSKDKSYSIILLLDGFDEIHVKYTNRVIEMLKQLSLNKSLRFIISSRAHSVNLLAKIFNVKLMFLEPFSEENQISFLRKIWNVTNDDEPRFLSYSTRLLEKFHSSVQTEWYGIPGMPLLMRMLGEVYSCKFEESKTLRVQQFDFSKDKLNIIELFEQFVRKCFDVELVEKYKHLGNFCDAELDILFMDYELEHQLLAMTLLEIEVPEGLFQNPRLKRMYDNFKIRCGKETEKSLLVKAVGNNVQFCHRLYSEFIIARYMCDRIFTLNAKLVICILSEHDVIRRLLMIMLGETDDFSDILNDLCKLDWRIALWACETGCLANVSALSQNFNEFSFDKLNMMLQVSPMNVYSEICDVLISRLTNIELCSALHSAVENGYEHLTRLLLKCNTIVNCRNAGGRTPLHMAAFNGNIEIAKILVTKNADVNAVDKQQMTALHLAAKKGQLRVAQLLTGKSANLNALDENQYTAIHFATEAGHMEVIKLLIDCGLNIHSQTIGGETPLHFAASNGHLEIVHFLKLKNADVNAVDKNQSTALHVAARGGHIEVIKLLIACGANIKSQTIYGETPLLIAARRGHMAIALLLILRTPNHIFGNFEGLTRLKWTFVPIIIALLFSLFLYYRDA